MHKLEIKFLAADSLCSHEQLYKYSVLYFSQYDVNLAYSAVQNNSVETAVQD